MLKTILNSQDQAYRGMIDIIMKQFNEKIEKLQTTVSDLTRSLEFSQMEVDELKHRVKDLELNKKTHEDTTKVLHEDLKMKEEKICTLEKRTNYMEDYSRRSNLQIAGMEERQGGETWEQTAVAVSGLLENKLGLPNIDLERAHRVGQRLLHRPRPVIVRFKNYCDREAVLRNVAKLRGTKIFINEDLCPASQALKNEQLPLLKQARAEGKIAYFRHTKLVIRERPNAVGGPGDVGRHAGRPSGDAGPRASWAAAAARVDGTSRAGGPASPADSSSADGDAAAGAAITRGAATAAEGDPTTGGPGDAAAAAAAAAHPPPPPPGMAASPTDTAAEGGRNKGPSRAGGGAVSRTLRSGSPLRGQPRGKGNKTDARKK